MKHAPRGPVKGDPIRDANPLRGEGWRGCVATNRQGKPCKGQAILGGHVCRMHGGSAPQVKASARERLMALQPKAIQTLDTLLGRDEFPTVQLGAAKDVLDRTDGKAGETLTVNVALTVVSERLLIARKRLAARILNIENP